MARPHLKLSARLAALGGVSRRSGARQHRGIIIARHRRHRRSARRRGIGAAHRDGSAWRGVIGGMALISRK